MKVIANPIDKHLPSGGAKIGLSVDGRLVSSVRQLTSEIAEAQNGKEGNNFLPPTVIFKVISFIFIQFVIGAVAHSDPVTEKDYGAAYVTDTVAISSYGLSAACCASKLCHGFEELWGVN
jgi:rRNA pseudouridine-1189 N-methylase Emg1 (Nep1/Mra1 family)